MLPISFTRSQEGQANTRFCYLWYSFYQTIYTDFKHAPRADLNLYVLWQESLGTWECCQRASLKGICFSVMQGLSGLGSYHSFLLHGHWILPGESVGLGQQKSVLSLKPQPPPPPPPHTHYETLFPLGSLTILMLFPIFVRFGPSIRTLFAMGPFPLNYF